MAKKRTRKIERLRPQIPYSEDTEMIAYEEARGTDRHGDVYRIYQPKAVTGHTQENERTWTFRTTGDVLIRVHVLNSHVLRIRYGIDNSFDADFSYGIDPKFKPQTARYHFRDHDDFYEVGTDKVFCRLNKKTARVEFVDGNNYVLLEESEPARSSQTILRGVTDVDVLFKHRSGTHYFGLGDKASELDLLGQQFTNWNTDSFGYGVDSDPYYRAIPFYYGLTPEHQAYGVFVDNTYRSTFDFARLNAEEVQILLAGGEMNYYFIAGPELDDVSRRYHDLTGTPELPPLWGLGFHQSRWSYYPEERVYELADKFREERMPCDAIYLDIDYMDEYRCFTWDREYFPDPARMIERLRQQGFQTLVMIDPGIKKDEDGYWVYDEGTRQNVWCKRSNGDIMIGPVWPDNCVWPDYTNPRVRDWWGKLYRELYTIHGVSGFWNDMNEPAVFRVNHMTFPDHVLHDYDGHPTDHRKAHNIYGLTMSRATQEGLKKLKKRKRPYVLTRASYAGGQRFAACWTGDNVATWEHLGIANRQCQRMSISGFSLIGSDVGGFFQDPDGELFTRWMQLAAFHPVYRVHTMGNNNDGAAQVDKEARSKMDAIDRRDQEPWAYGAPYTDAVRAAMNLRYRLLPYMYTALRRNVEEGVPVLRSLVFEDQTDPKLIDQQHEFVCGRHLLVAPVMKNNAFSRRVYLPRGVWFDFFTGERMEAQTFFDHKVELETIPVYARAGAVVPLYPVMQYANERPVEELTLRAFFGLDLTTSELYEDAGEGYGYRNRDYHLRVFHTLSNENHFILTQETVGRFETTYTTVRLELAGVPFAHYRLEVDGQRHTATEEGGFLVLRVSPNFGTLEVIAE